MNSRLFVNSNGRGSEVPVLYPILALLLSFLITAVSAFAQGDPFTTVSTPAGKSDSAGSGSLLTTVSSPSGGMVNAAQLPADKPVDNHSASSAPAGAAKPDQEWEQELLRDPFWPIGYFPKDWNLGRNSAGAAAGPVDPWQAASRKLRIGGASSMNGRATILVNGEFKAEGDTVGVFYDGKTYQWKIVKIESNGRIELKKEGIK